MARVSVVTRILAVIVGLWATVQTVYLAFTFSSGPPSPDAELMSSVRQTLYVASLAFHSFAILFCVYLFWAEARERIWVRIKGMGGLQQLMGFSKSWSRWHYLASSLVPSSGRGMRSSWTRPTRP